MVDFRNKLDMTVPQLLWMDLPPVLVWSLLASGGAAATPESGSTLSATVGTAISAGYLAVVAVLDSAAVSGNQNIGTMADSKGNSYSLAVSEKLLGSASINVAIFYSVLTAPLTSSDTFTYTTRNSGTDDDILMKFSVWSGNVATSVLDTTAAGTLASEGTTVPSITNTPVDTADLFISCCAIYVEATTAQVTYAHDSANGWTLVGTETSVDAGNNGDWLLSMEYIAAVGNSAETFQPSFTRGTSTFSWASSVSAAFKS